MTIHQRTWVIVGGLATCVAGCSSPSKPVMRHAPVVERPTVRQTSFAFAVLTKPHAESSADVDLNLAPLIIEEVDRSRNGPGSADRFGALQRDDAGAMVIDPDRPTVYVASSKAIVHGIEHAQWVFHWWYPAEWTAGEGSNPRWRLLRMTLDRDGMPAIWEVLSPEARALKVYVSKRLEEDAEAEFGRAFAGRRFAVERKTTDQSDVIVERTLDDAPRPIGPIVYAEARAREVVTLLCRCMPSQVGEIVEAGYYALRPAGDLADIGCPPSPDSLFLPLTDVELPAIALKMTDPNWLERALRVPGGF